MNQPDTTITLEYGGTRGMDAAFFSTQTGQKKRVSDLYVYDQYRVLVNQQVNQPEREKRSERTS